jgi:hypothetical protein
MKASQVCWSRRPTRHEMTSRDSVSSATKVYASPTPGASASVTRASLIRDMRQW